MKLMAEIRSVLLEDLPPGSLFMYDGELAFKSEYKSDNGACECYIVGAGCSFWGGRADKELNKLWVHPVVEVTEHLVAPYTE